MDVNDHIPQFTQSQYNGSIYEDSPMGTVVARVRAFDKDSGNYGKVVYTNIYGDLAKK